MESRCGSITEPLPELLTNLSQMTGYTYRQVDDLHFFGSPEIKPDKVNPLIERKTIWLSHLEADTVLNLLPIHIPKQNIVVSPTHNTVTVVGSPRADSRDRTVPCRIGRCGRCDSEPPRAAARLPLRSGNGTGRLSVDLLDAPFFDVIRQLSIRHRNRYSVLRRRWDGAGGANYFASRRPTWNFPAPAKLIDRHGNPSSGERHFRVRSVGTVLGVRLRIHMGRSVPANDKPMLIVGSDMNAPFVEEELIALNYLDVPKAMELCCPVPLNVHVSPLAGSKRLAGGQATTARKSQRFGSICKAVDVPQPQAMIQLYLLELTKGNRRRIGAVLSTPTENRAVIQTDDGIEVNFDSLASVPQAFGAKLSALVKENRGKGARQSVSGCGERGKGVNRYWREASV